MTLQYSDKLKDPRWQKKRLKIFQRDKWMCQICGETSIELVVHHKEYINNFEPWEHPDSSLETRCVNCHEGEHGIIKQIGRLLLDAIEDIEERHGKNIGPGIMFGSPFSELDTILGGMQNGHLIVIASRPQMGKTDFVYNIATNVAKSDIPTFIFSLDQSGKDLGYQFLSAEVMEVGGVKAGLFTMENWHAFTDRAGMIHESPLYVDETPNLTFSTIARRTRNSKSDKDIRLLIVDNLDLLSISKYHIADILINFKKLAREIEIPIIVLTSMIKPHSHITGPKLSDFICGEIPIIADDILLVWRADYYNDLDDDDPNKNIFGVEIPKCKDRKFYRYLVKLHFDRNTRKFSEFQE